MISNPTETKLIIDSLKKDNLAELSVNYIKNKIVQLWQNYTYTTLILPTGNGKLHRAIKHKKRPNSIKDLSYPPINYAKLNRANFPGVPMFYCSGDPRTTFFELGVEAGDTVVLSKWILKNEIVVFPIGYTKVAFEKLKSSRNCPLLIPDKHRHPDESRSTNLRISKFLNEVFTEKIESGYEHKYKLTAAIAEQFLSISSDHGLVYPTIAMQANAENFALTTKLVDQHLQLESVTWYEIISAKDFYYTIQALAFADSFPNGQIVWGIPPAEKSKFL